MADNRLEFALTRPTRKGEAPLLAAHAGLSAARQVCAVGGTQSWIVPWNS